MPPIELACRFQKAVLWEAYTTDSYGRPVVDDPVEIEVRWIVETRETVDAQRNPITSSVTVVADRSIPIESILWLGSIDALPETPDNLMRVVSMKETPDIKNRHTRYEAFLAKYSDSLPLVSGTG
jgi:hypothetical protein